VPPQGLRPAATAELGSAGRTWASAATWFVSAARLLLTTFREIFDETAYSRFLARQEMSSCPRAYAAFVREQELTKARRPRCC
jgi:hypothetical protein